MGRGQQAEAILYGRLQKSAPRSSQAKKYFWRQEDNQIVPFINAKKMITIDEWVGEDMILMQTSLEKIPMAWYLPLEQALQELDVAFPVDEELQRVINHASTCSSQDLSPACGIKKARQGKQGKPLVVFDNSFTGHHDYCHLNCILAIEQMFGKDGGWFLHNQLPDELVYVQHDQIVASVYAGNFDTV